ncbi:hypothetical protein IJH97_01850 [Candidatus Saccharibacteria bacterium]|nr:hypothetical protein [Candidatus Saccharibacteria bacterium]
MINLKLQRLQSFYYRLLFAVVAILAVSGIIFSLGNFSTTASAETSTPLANDSNLGSSEPTASVPLSIDNTPIDSSPTAVTTDSADQSSAHETTSDDTKPTTNIQKSATNKNSAQPEETAQTTKTAQPATSTPSTPAPYITAGGRTNHISTVVNDPNHPINPGNEVKRFQFETGRLTNFYIGHNYANVFGGLQYHHIGDTISITDETGSTRYYTIRLMLWLDFNETAENMMDIALSIWHGTQYSVSLMTCTSNDYNGGRLVIFAS